MCVCRQPTTVRGTFTVKKNSERTGQLVPRRFSSFNCERWPNCVGSGGRLSRGGGIKCGGMLPHAFKRQLSSESCRRRASYACQLTPAGVVGPPALASLQMKPHARAAVATSTNPGARTSSAQLGTRGLQDRGTCLRLPRRARPPARPPARARAASVRSLASWIGLD